MKGVYFWNCVVIFALLLEYVLIINQSRQITWEAEMNLVRKVVKHLTEMKLTYLFLVYLMSSFVTSIISSDHILFDLSRYIMAKMSICIISLQENIPYWKWWVLEIEKSILPKVNDVEPFWQLSQFQLIECAMLSAISSRIPKFGLCNISDWAKWCEWKVKGEGKGMTFIPVLHNQLCSISVLCLLPLSLSWCVLFPYPLPQAAYTLKWRPSPAPSFLPVLL